MKTKLIIVAAVTVIATVIALHTGSHPMKGHCLKKAGTAEVVKK